jgi:hypothetical protein
MPAVGVQAAFQGLPFFAAQIGVPLAGLDNGSRQRDAKAEAVIHASPPHRAVSDLLWTDGHAGSGTGADY